MTRRVLKVVVTGDTADLSKSLKDAGHSVESFEKKTDELNEKTGNLGRNMGKVGLAIGAAFGAAAIGAGAALFKIGSDFDKAYDTIRVGTGATGETLAGLNADMRKVFASTPASMQDAGKAIADLNTALGITGKPLQDLSVQLLNLSRLTKTDLGANVTSVTRLFGDWGVAVDKQSDSLDFLFKVSQSTGTGVDKIAELAVNAGAPMRALGFSFEETASLIGKWNKEGVNTEIVLSGLRKANGVFVKEFGAKAPAAFRKFVAEIKKAPNASAGAALAIDRLGIKAGPDFAAAVMEGRFEIEELMASLDASPETINGAAEATESFGEKWQRIKNRVLVGLEPLASRVFDGVGRAMDRLAPVVDRSISAVQGLIAVFDAEGLGGVLRRVGGLIRDTVPEAAKALWEWIVAATPVAVEKARLLAVAVGTWLRDTGLPWVGARLVEGASWLWSWIQEKTPQVIAALVTLSHRMGSWFGERAPEWASQLAQFVGQLPEKITDAASRVDWGSLLREAGIKMSQGMLAGFMVGPGGFLLGFGKSTGLIQEGNRLSGATSPTGREFGGPVRKGQPYIVGERRAELFVPDVNGTIMPRVPSAGSPMTGGGGGSVNVVIELDKMVLAQATVRASEAAGGLPIRIRAR